MSFDESTSSGGGSYSEIHSTVYNSSPSHRIDLEVPQQLENASSSSTNASLVYNTAQVSQQTYNGSISYKHYDTLQRRNHVNRKWQKKNCTMNRDDLLGMYRKLPGSVHDSDVSSLSFYYFACKIFAIRLYDY